MRDKHLHISIFCSIVFIIILSLQTVSSSMDVAAQTVTMDVPAQIVNNRTLIPIRFVTENMDCNVVWDGSQETQTVTISNENTTIVMKKNEKDSVFSKTVTVDGIEETIDVPAQIIKDRTCMPARFIAENLGFSVDYEGSTKTVTILGSKDTDNIIQLTIDSNQARIIRNTPDAKEIRAAFMEKERVEAKNIVVANLNHALDRFEHLSSGINSFNISQNEVAIYEKTGSSEGLKTFQVLDYVASDGQKLPGLIMMTDEKYGLVKNAETMKKTINWLNEIDPTLMRSFLTTKYVSGNIYPGDVFIKYPTFGATYFSSEGIILINESMTGGKGYLIIKELAHNIIGESMAIKLERQTNLKDRDIGVSKGYAEIDWANKMKSEGKISEEDNSFFVSNGNNLIDYYKANYQ